MATQYIDDIQFVLHKMRESLRERGFATDLQQEKDIYKDQDFLRNPDPETGYRAYHLYIGVSLVEFTISNPVICELQVRTELQDIWAVRSHRFIYKKHDRAPKFILKSMKHVSESLTAADTFIVDIRNEVLQTEKK